jgi:GNAT superfamily N-acetyltransferase
MEITFDYSLPAAEAYFELFETTGWNDEYHVSAEALARANATSQFMVSAYEGGRLVGFGRLQSDGVLHAMIYEMIVHPDQRGKGIGSQILQQLIRWCRENHIREAQLFCAHGRRGFYERNGFVARPQDAPGMQMILTSQ